MNPGDPNGILFEGEQLSTRALPVPVPSLWSGWPSGWATPDWAANKAKQLIDVAWGAIDLNSSVLAAMPPYRTRSGRIIEPTSWMENPDPLIYSSWAEFAKQLFWDYHLGEAFVLAMSRGADGYPLQLRVVPPWLMNVELRNGTREYSIGNMNVTGDVLHVRYQSTTDDARGHGPLEAAGARVVAAGLLQRYANHLVETGGIPHYWIEIERRLNQTEANELLDQWVASRARRAGEPALLSGGAGLRDLKAMSAKEMALVELSQLNESRISMMLGVPPELAALPSGADSLTYKNQEGIYDFHDRSSLRPKANAVMSALSSWALPRGQSIELNRDEYTRPAMKERFDAYAVALTAGFMDADEVRAAERLHGEMSAAQLTGGETPSTAPPAPA